MASTGGSNPLSQGSNPWGRTMIESYLKRKAKLNLKRTKQTIDSAMEFKDTQWFLNYLDDLNSESVRY